MYQSIPPMSKEDFLADFPRQLEAYTTARAAIIGDKAQWRPLWDKTEQKIRLSNGKTLLKFRVHGVPEKLSDDEQNALRKSMYNICTQHGFARTGHTAASRYRPANHPPPMSKEDFIADFPRQLEVFAQKRAADVGNPAEWKPYMHNTEMHFHNNDRIISFTLRGMPQDLSAEDKAALRQAIYSICSEHGFQSKKASSSPSSYDGLENDDPQTWEKFVSRQQPALQRYAYNRMGSRRNHSILDPEDITQIALLKLLNASRSNKVDNPADYAAAVVLSEADQARKVRTKQKFLSRNTDLLSASDIDHEEKLETLRDQLPRVLEEAKKCMTDRQLQILKCIEDQMSAPEATPFSGKDLAKMTGASKPTISRELRKITTKIQIAARFMGTRYEEIAAIIDDLSAPGQRSHKLG